jgi:ABC-type polysaccharide/polyol phosphate export permease
VDVARGAATDGLEQPETSHVWVENRPTKGRRALRLDEVWRFRELVWFLALRDLKVRYKQAAFGVGWALLQPIVGAAVLTVVFRRLAGVSSNGIPYLAFAYVGYAVWSYFSTSITNTVSTLVENSALVTKVYFPRLVAPLASSFPGLLDLGLALMLLVPLMMYYGIVPTAALVTLPLWIAALLISMLGAGLLLATLNVWYRDVHHLVNVGIQIWLFASPVAYPASLVHGGLRYVYFLNPIAGVLEGFRWCLLAGPAPKTPALVSLGSGLVLLYLGIRYFQASERRFADVI